MARPESGTASGRRWRSCPSERWILRREMLACISARAARRMMRSWKEKRYWRRGPRAGRTKPSLIRPCKALRGSCRTRSTSRMLYRFIGDPLLQVRAPRLQPRLLAFARLACRLGRLLLGALRRPARAQLSGRCAGRIRFLETRAQRLHEVDDLAATLGREVRHRDLVALDFLVDRGLNARPQLIGVGRRIEPVRGLLIDELLGQGELRRLDLLLRDLDLARGPHIGGEVQLLHGEHVADRSQHDDVSLAAGGPAAYIVMLRP